MPRYRLTLEYDGGPFVGWQRQTSGPSVQAALEAALAKFAGEAPEVVAAGRTDAGVHALGQVVHFDLARVWDPRRICDALNYHLRPDPVVALAAAETQDDFHARLSAVKRSYLYRILNRRAPPALDAGRVWPVEKALDAEAMHDAAQLLVGHHDFTSFRASICQARSPVKTLDLLAVRRAGEEIHVDAVARSFLHHQVRNIVGTLVQVGLGRWTRHDVAAALAARDRRAAGPTAPPGGLYLVAVAY
ncbi:MAG: tRNA pseudouridine(38-40) synthase TruA [Rhodospirillales bacterium]|jgi:tRNA pseudouridine38-40 synthase